MYHCTSCQHLEQGTYHSHCAATRRLQDGSYTTRHQQQVPPTLPPLLKAILPNFLTSRPPPRRT